MQNNNLVIASDHAGFELKKNIVSFFASNKNSILDLGTHDTKSVDYPDYVNKVVEHITAKNIPKGILVCNTGIGMSIAANRNSNIRAALCANETMAKYARLHNDANILVLGSQFVDKLLAYDIITQFLTTKFEGGRHVARLAKIF